MVRRAALLVLIVAASAGAQTPQRRLTTVHAIRQFPAYYHLQNVLLHGEFTDDLGAEASAKAAESRLVLRSGEQELRIVLDQGTATLRGPVEVRGHVVDIGRLNPDDPRLGPFAQRAEQGGWPKPGEELFLRATSISAAQSPATPTIRALALEPWRYAGEKITLTGNFRGRNLFGDQPGAPAKSRYDFVLRGAEGTVWVTGLRPRGKGFELDVDRRIDADRWVEITGTVVLDKGLVMIEGTTVTMAKAPEVQTAPVEAVPEVPKLPVEVVFNSPREGETDVKPTDAVRVQFARGLNEKTLAGKTLVTAAGAAADAPGLAHKAVYDAGSRSVSLRFDAPLPAFSTFRVRILEGVLGFDGAPVTPWSITFTTGG